MSEYVSGRELDIRIGIAVMGWTPRYAPEPIRSRGGQRVSVGTPDELDFWQTPRGEEPCGWSPSTDVSDAWEVVEKVRQTMAFELYDRGDMRIGVKFGHSHEVADTAPLAICRAALAAVGAA